MRDLTEPAKDRKMEKPIGTKGQIRSYRDLRLYQAAFDLQQEIFERSKKFPKSEMYALTDQVRRSSRSIGANLAEAWLRPVGKHV